MAEPFVGQIILVAFNFAPRGYAFCNGQIMSIAQNTALFSLLGTTYGGNGQTTFALPDLRGRAPLSSGQGPGLQLYDLGQFGGTESITLTINQMPQHNHVVTLNNLAATSNVTNTPANRQSPGGNLLATEAAGVTATYSNAGSDAALAAGAITVSGTATAAVAGGNQPFSNATPYLVLNYCIALQGIFPSRN